MSAIATQVTPESLPRSVAWDWTRKLLPALAFLSLFFYCVYGAYSVNLNTARLAHNAWDNMFPEGAHAYAAIRAAETGRLYYSYRESPHIVQSYGPLFYVVAAGLARVAHLNIERTIDYNRLASYVSYLLIGVFSFLICRKLERPPWLAGLAALMVLGQHDFLGWNVTVRPDMMMVLFMAVSLWLVLHADDSPFWAPFLSGACAGIAFLFKQPGAGVAISSVLVLLFWKDFRKAITLCTGAAIPVVALFGFLVFRGEHFVEQFRAVGKAIWLPSGLPQFLWKYCVDVTYIVPLVICGIGAAAALKMGKQWQFVAVFTLLNGLIGIVGLPQLGANTNYFLPGLLGCGLLLPAAYEAVRQRPYLAALSLLLIPSFLYAAEFGNVHNVGYMNFFRAPAGINYEPLKNLRVFTDIPNLGLKGREPELLDAFAVRSLELTGNWDSAPVVDEIRRQEFDVVIMKRIKPNVVLTPRARFERIVTSYRGVSEFSPAVVSALNDNYEILCSSIFSVVLKPRGKPLDLTAAYFSGYFPGFPCGTGATSRPPDLAVTHDTPQHYAAY